MFCVQVVIYLLIYLEICKLVLFVFCFLTEMVLGRRDSQKISNLLLPKEIM